MARLNGWRRLFVVYMVLMLPASIVIADRWLTPFARVAHLREENVSYDVDLMKRFAQRDEDVPDLKAALAQVDTFYDPLIADAMRAGNRLRLWSTLAIWASLTGATYAAGATFAWIRRGFNAGEEDE